MRLYRVIIIFIVITPIFGFAQIEREMQKINADSLVSVLPDLAGTDKVDALNKIAFKICYKNPDSCISISNRAIMLSRSIEYRKGEAVADFNIANGYFFQDSIRQSVTNYLNALGAFEELDVCPEMAYTLNILSYLNWRAGKLHQSVRQSLRVIEIADHLADNHYRIMAMIDASSHYTKIQEFDSANILLNDALLLLEQYPDTLLLSKVYLYKGYNIVRKVDDLREENLSESTDDYFRESIFWLLKAIDLERYYNFNTNTDFPHYLSIYNNLAWSYLNLNTERDFNLGLNYLNKLKTIVDTLPTKIYYKIYAYENLANLSLDSGNYQAAIKIFKEGIEKAHEAKKNYSLNKYENFNPFYEKVAEDHYYAEILMKAYGMISDAYLKLGDFKNAHEYYIYQETTRNEIYREDYKNLIAMLEAESENEKTQNHISLLTKENEVKDLRINRSRILVYGLSSLILVLIAISILYIRQRRIRMALKEQKLAHDLELRKIESTKLKELDKMKSRFFANISHEFRTPLTLILGPLQKFISNIEDRKSQSDLNIMQRNALRLQNLIDQLLSLSKLESGKMKLQLKEMDVIPLINAYVQSFESLAKQKSITLSFNSNRDEILKCWIDQDKLEKILYNLLSNAFKHAGNGGFITVDVTRISDQQSSGESVKVTVSDTGSGIPAEQLPHIFDRFYQVDDADSKNRKGTGIGLALTKELIGLHHGTIEVESTLGKGATFNVILPLGKEHFNSEELDQSTDYHTENSELHFSKTDFQLQESDVEDQNYGIQNTESINDLPLILLVEDSDDMRHYIRSYINSDFCVTEAVDGEDGYKKAVEKVPDLIISDVMMPKLDGMELCRKLKTDECTSHIPVILLTAKASMEDRLEGLETGADDFLTKPFDVQELLVRMNNLILQRKQLKEKFLNNSKILGLSQVLNLPESGYNSLDQQFLIRAIEIVNVHMLDEEFSVEIFGKEMSMGRTQLQKKLKSLLGRSPSAFIRTIRLNRAAELIKADKASISEIAFEVGFNNLSYFSKCFQEEFGVLPSDFKE